MIKLRPNGQRGTRPLIFFVLVLVFAALGFELRASHLQEGALPLEPHP
jgi:hypothetical protein